MVPAFGRWKRFDEARAALMRSELERIVAASGLSKDVYEHYAPLALTPDTKTAAWETRRTVEGRREDDQFVTVWRASEPDAPKTFKVDADEAFNSPSGLALAPDVAKFAPTQGAPSGIVHVDPFNEDASTLLAPAVAVLVMLGWIGLFFTSAGARLRRFDLV